MALIEKIVRFAHKPLPDKLSALKATVRQAARKSRRQTGDVRYEEPIPAADYAPGAPARPRLALAGCGWFACEAHLPALKRLEDAQLVEMVALCSRSEPSLARAMSQFSGRELKQYRDLDAVLADPDIDVVDLVLPIPAMPAAIGAALRAGKHVISEKPCAPTMSQSLDLLDLHASLAQPPVWAVAENWRFKGIVRQIERIVADGGIGSVYLADFKFIAHGREEDTSWRGHPSYTGGHLLDSGVHFVALLRQVVGEVETVSASISQKRAYLPPADSVTATLTFSSGAEGSFQMSFAAPSFCQPSCMLRLIGSEGSLSVDFFGEEIRLRDRSGEQVTRVPGDPWVQGGVQEMLMHCLGSIRHGSPLRSSADEAMRDVAVIEAMLKSSRERQIARPDALFPPLRGGGRAVTTFGGFFNFRPRHIIDCGSLSDVQRAVASTSAAGLRMRPMGSAHSWGPELPATDVSLRLAGLNRIRTIDVAQKTVSVDAGVRLGDLTRALARQGLSLPSLSFVRNVTVGGAVASGTHGTSPKWGSLSDCVREMTMVLPSGDVRRLGQNTHPDALRAGRVAVGMLGVIVALELDVVPLPWVRRTEIKTDLASFLAQRSSMLARYEHIWAHWTLGDDTVRAVCLEAGTQENGATPYVRDDGITDAFSLPSVSDTGRGDNQIWVSCQYGVPACQFEAAVDHIRRSAFAAMRKGRVVEIKFMKGEDRSFLGFNADGDCVLFNIWWAVDQGEKEIVFDPFEETMRDMHAKPHWGKIHRPLDLDYVQRAYPHWHAFEAVRSSLDPKGMFSIFPEHRS